MSAERTKRRVGLALGAAALLSLGWLARGALAPVPLTIAPEGGASATAAESETLWTCSMHPQIRLPSPGQCPICFMDLIPLKRAAAGGPPRRIALDPSAVALAGVRTVLAERRHVDAEVALVGRVAYDQARLAEITAWVGGRIERLYVDSAGVSVRAGEHLVELYSPELYAAQAELLQAAQAAREAEARKGASSAAFGSTLAASREKLRLYGLEPQQIEAIEASGQPAPTLTLHATRGGVVLAKDVQEGAWVQTGTRIYAIADLSHVWVLLEAYEPDLVWLRYGQTVEFTTAARPGETFRGTIALIDPVLDPRTRTVRVRVNVDNEAGLLKPDMFVRARVRAHVAAGGRVIDPRLAGRFVCSMHPEVIRDEPGTCPLCGMELVTAESLGWTSAASSEDELPLVIPDSAPLVTGERAVVYVAIPGEEGVFEGREIVLGPRAGHWYVVRTGLAEGDRVVARGAFAIDSELQIQARPSMMSPPAEPSAETGSAQAPPRAPASTPRAAPSRAALPDGLRPGTGRLWRAYLELAGALAADDDTRATAAARDLREAQAALVSAGVAGPPGWTQAVRALDAPLAALAEATSIEARRAAFERASDALRALLAGFDAELGTVLEIHCPMAFEGRGAIWLQESAEVHNPYFGARMLRCGDVLGPLGEEDHRDH